MRQAAWWPRISLFFVLALLAIIEGETAARASDVPVTHPHSEVG